MVSNSLSPGNWGARSPLLIEISRASSTLFAIGIFESRSTSLRYQSGSDWQFKTLGFCRWNSDPFKRSRAFRGCAAWMEYFEPFVPSFKFGKEIHRYDCPRASLGVPVARFDGFHDLIYQI
jgi:hypothetical protein